MDEKLLTLSAGGPRFLQVAVLEITQNCYLDSKLKHFPELPKEKRFCLLHTSKGLFLILHSLY